MEKDVAALTGFFTIGVVVMFGDVIVTSMLTDIVITEIGVNRGIYVRGATNLLVRKKR